MSVRGSTAEICAAFRALAGVDPHASRFLRGARVTTLARARPLRPLLRATSRRLVRGAYDYERVRTRHLDEVVARELAAGAEQLLLLGAGFDSRGHRFALRTFEVDLPEIQRRKRRLARRIAGRPVYVAADLERDDVLGRLVTSGFDPAARTVVLWIGVSMYVSEAAVRRALALAARLAPGSLVAFDYVCRAPDPDFARAVERRGEPVRFVAASSQRLAAAHGIRLELDLRGLPYPFVAVAHARVPERPVGERTEAAACENGGAPRRTTGARPGDVAVPRP